MKIDAIKSNLTNVSKSALKSVNSVGSSAIKAKAHVVKFASDNAKKFIKSEQIPDSFKTAKQNLKNIKVPDFMKPVLEFVKNHKETFAGGAVILAAIACAGAIVKSITGNIKEASIQEEAATRGKDFNKLHTHQG